MESRSQPCLYRYGQKKATVMIGIARKPWDLLAGTSLLKSGIIDFLSQSCSNSKSLVVVGNPRAATTSFHYNLSVAASIIVRHI